MKSLCNLFAETEAKIFSYMSIDISKFKTRVEHRTVFTTMLMILRQHTQEEILVFP